MANAQATPDGDGRHVLESMYSMIALIFIIFACVELCDAATIVDVHRLIQYDISGAHLGSRLANLNHHAGSLNFAPGSDLSRSVLIIPLHELNISFVTEYITPLGPDPLDNPNLGPFLLKLGSCAGKFSRYVQLGDTYSMLGQLGQSIFCYGSGLKIQKETLVESDPRVAKTRRRYTERRGFLWWFWLRRHFTTVTRTPLFCIMHLLMDNSWLALVNVKFPCLTPRLLLSLQHL